jgi:DNA invertase Pin-like site-specific DNA recombinase
LGYWLRIALNQHKIIQKGLAFSHRQSATVSSLGQQLLADIRAHRINVIVVYKVDRLTRSLADFAKLVELFDAHGVSFVSVTQQFNTTTSMGRLTLNVLLSFAQFEREVTSERIRDKIAASKRKGLWVGGVVPLGYQAKDRKITVVADEAKTVRHIFRRYLDLGSLTGHLQSFDIRCREAGRPRCLAKSYQGHFGGQCNCSHRCQNNDQDSEDQH